MKVNTDKVPDPGEIANYAVLVAQRVKGKQEVHREESKG